MIARLRFALGLPALTLLLACGDPTGLDEITPELREIFERMAAQEFETLSAEIEVSQRYVSADGAQVQPGRTMDIALELSRPGRFRCAARLADRLNGELVNDGTLQRHRTFEDNAIFLIPGVETWSDADRALIEQITQQEATLLIALFGWVPPYEELLALPTPKGEEAVTIERGGEEIDGRLCDAVTLRNVLQGQTCATRYVFDAETGMLLRLEFTAVDPAGVRLEAVEEFASLDVDVPLPAETFDPTPAHGVPPHGALFSAEAGEPIALRDAMAAAAPPPFVGTVQSLRWRRNGPRETIGVEIDIPSETTATVVATSEPWVQPSRLSLSGGALAITSQFRPRTEATPATVREIPCEALADMGLPHFNLLPALLGLECEPLASLMANATNARTLGQVERGGRTLDILAARTRYASGADVTVLIGVESESRVPHTFEIYEPIEEGRIQRMVVEWLEAR